MMKHFKIKQKQPESFKKWLICWINSVKIIKVHLEDLF